MELYTRCADEKKSPMRFHVPHGGLFQENIRIGNLGKLIRYVKHCASQKLPCPAPSTPSNGSRQTSIPVFSPPLPLLLPFLLLCHPCPISKKLLFPHCRFVFTCRHVFISSSPLLSSPAPFQIKTRGRPQMAFILRLDPNSPA